MKYIRLYNNIVMEIIPAENPAFPGLPIEKRYSAAFLAKLKPVEDTVEVEQGWVYDPETDTYAQPPEPAVEPVQDETVPDEENGTPEQSEEITGEDYSTGEATG